MTRPIRHFLQFSDLAPRNTRGCSSARASSRSASRATRSTSRWRDRTLAMIFEKASTRTRVWFEAGMYQMGGSVIHLTTGDSQLGRAEPIEDTARVIWRMVDIVMIRTYEQAKIDALRRALARAGHQRPDQRVPPLPDPGRHLHLPRAPRPDRRPHGGVGRRRQQHGLHLAAGRRSARLHGARVDAARLCDRSATRARRSAPRLPLHDPLEAARGADLVTTDVWTSMGYEAENEARRKAFADWCVDER